MKVRIYLIEGLVRDTGDLLTVLFIGNEQTAYQFASLAYSRIDKVHFLGESIFRQIHSVLTADVSGIIAVRVDRPFLKRFSREGYLLLPNVSFDLDLRRSFDSLVRSMSRRRRRDIRKIEERGFNYRISNDDDEAFELFYSRMYLPYAKGRFGKATHIKAYSESKALYEENGGVIFVTIDERPVAGILFRIVQRTLFALSLGVCEDSERPIKDLCGQAALFFLIKWAKSRGMSNLNYGVSMPFLHEGIFTFKKEWGMSVTDETEESVCALKLNSLSEGPLSFLKQNPFIILDKKTLKGVVFLNHKPTQSEVQQEFSKSFLLGLDSLIIVSYYSPDGKAQGRDKIPNVARGLSRGLKPLLDICHGLRTKGFEVEFAELKGSEMNTHTGFSNLACAQKTIRHNEKNTLLGKACIKCRIWESVSTRLRMRRSK